MPNDNSAVCGCGVVLELPKSRTGGSMSSLGSRSYTILVPPKDAVAPRSGSKGGSNKMEGRPAMKKPSELLAAPRPASNMGSTSSVAESSSGAGSRSRGRKDKRTTSSRRTRSAERAESHYTYIDSGSSYVSLRENAIVENLYCTIDDNLIPSGHHQQQQQQQQGATTGTTGTTTAASPGSQNGRPAYAVPSMTSPPPTYDVAIAKTWQTGLPPSYEEYLFHKRSHTPPPPWTDSAQGGGGVAPGHSLDLRTASQISQELLANQPELREYLTQLALQGGAEAALHHYQQLLLQQQALRKQAARAQRSRAMPPRSQSESRAQQQQRIAYEDGAFCMETTAIQSAFENGVAFCSLM